MGKHSFKFCLFPNHIAITGLNSPTFVRGPSLSFSGDTQKPLTEYLTTSRENPGPYPSLCLGLACGTGESDEK